MRDLCFEINSNEELWSLIDKNLEYIFIHKFKPNQRIAWWKTSLKMNNLELFEDLQVRNMEFDIQTDLNGLKRIIDLNSTQLRIYQFEKPIPDTLVLEYLPENNRDKILRQNGLKHFFFCDFEFLTIGSVDDQFLIDIENNPNFIERIIERKNE
jgi:hypothetical protein